MNIKGKRSSIHGAQGQGWLQLLVPFFFFITVWLLGCIIPASAASTINRISGRLSIEDRDITLQAGAVSMGVSRTLNRMPEGSGFFGANWMSNWERRLTEIDAMIILSDSSETVFFEKTGPSEYRSRTGERLVAEANGTRTRHKTDATSERYSSDGRLMEIRYPSGNSVTLTYDARNSLIRISGPRNQTIDITSDDQGRALRIETSTGIVSLYTYENDHLRDVSVDGRTVSRFTYDTLGRLESIEEPASGTTRLSYNNEGRIISRKFADGSEEKYHYDDMSRRYLQSDPSGAVTTTTVSDDRRTQEIIDPLGNRKVLLYDSDGRIVKTAEPSGADIAMTYDSLGRIVSLRDTLGRTTRYDYSGDTSLLKRSVRADGIEITYDYDDQQRIRSVKIGDKTVLARTYTPDGLVERMKGSGIPETVFGYHPDGRLKSASNALGEKTIYEYDRRGNLIRETTPSGGVISSEFDSLNRKLRETDPAGLTTRYSYDNRGYLSKIIHPDNRITTYQYDAMGRLLSVTMPSGETISHVYDKAGRVIQTTGPGIMREDFTYDAVGNVLQKSDQWGNIFRYEYNENGRIVKEETPAGLVIRFYYDRAGNVTSREDSSGSRTEYLYDIFGQPTRIIEGAPVTNYAYDAIGRLISVTDANGKKKEFSYGFEGMLNSVLEPNGDRARYEYDPAGRIITGQRPSGGIMQFGYDTSGNLISEKDPLGNEQRYSYNPAGRLIKKTKASGQAIAMTYNSSGQLAEEKFPDGRTIRYTYDNRGNRIEAADGKFPVRYTYDRDNRLSAAEYTAVKKTIRNEYNDKGLRSRLLLPDNKELRYEYDNSGRLSAIVLPDGKKVRFTYDLRDRREKIIYSNGVAGTYEYDAEGHTAAITYRTDGGKILFSERYTYDAGGNMIRREDADRLITAYRYDSSGQLIEEIGPAGTIQLSYGPGGNRTELRRSNDTTQYRYDKADRMTAAGSETLNYDADGNLITRKGASQKSYAYDAQNRLIRAADSASGEVSYGYDHTGARVWRRDSNGTTYFLYDGLDLIQEIGERLDSQATYIFAPGIDRPIAMLRDGKTYYYHADRLGSIRQLTDDQGQIAALYDYDAFGKITKQEANVQNPFTYTAREVDTATGLYYYRARFYDPDLGRFISSDPMAAEIDAVLDLNPYLYAKNNPIRFTDPLGLETGLFFANMSAEGAEIYRLNLMKNDFQYIEQNYGFSTPQARQDWLNAVSQQEVRIRQIRAGSAPPPSVTQAIRPGGGRAHSTVVVRPGGGNAPPPSRTSLMNRIGAGAGAILAGLNYKACRDEGNSHAECLKELGIGVVAGVVVGGGIALVAGSTAPIIGVAGLVIGGVTTGARYVYAQTSEDAEQSNLSDDRIEELLNHLDAKIQELRDLNREIGDLHDKIQKTKEHAEESSEKVEKAAEKFADSINKVSESGKELLSTCSDIRARIAKAEACASHASNAAMQAARGLNDAIAVLTACVSSGGSSPVAAANGIQQAALASKKTAETYLQSGDCRTDGIKKELSDLKTEFRNVRDEINKINALREGIKTWIATGKIEKSVSPEMFNDYAVRLATLASYADTAKKDRNNAQKLTEELGGKKEELNKKKQELLKTIEKLRNVLPQRSMNLRIREEKINAIAAPDDGTLTAAIDTIKDWWTAGSTAVNVGSTILSALSGISNLDSSLSSCESLSADAADKALQAAVESAAGLDALNQRISTLKEECAAKLKPKSEEQPPAAARITGVVVSPASVECEVGQMCPAFTAAAIYSDNSQIDVTGTAKWWPPQPIRAIAGESTFTITATYSGMSGTGQVVIKSKPKPPGPRLISSTLTPGEKTVTRGGPATGFVMSFVYIEYDESGGSAEFEMTIAPSCGNIPDRPGTHSVPCTGTDPILGRSHQMNAIVTVIGEPATDACPPDGPWRPDCDPNVKGGTKTGGPVDVGIPGGPGQGTRPTQGTAIGGSQPTQQPAGYTTPTQLPGVPTGDTTPPTTVPVNPCGEGYYLGPDNICRRDTPCPPRFVRSPVTGRCEPAGSPYDPSKPGSGPSKPGRGPIKPDKDGNCPPGCHLKPDGSGECHCGEEGGTTTPPQTTKPPSGTKPPPSKPPSTSRPTGGGGG